MTDEEALLELDRIRKLPWRAEFWRTLDNESVPGGKVDMYLLLDDDTGAGIVGLSVPHGFGRLAAYVALCCADPYFVRVRHAGDTEIAVAFNQALEPFVEHGTVDACEVHVAAMTLIESYVGALPRRTRQELIDNTIARLSEIRNRD